MARQKARFPIINSRQVEAFRAVVLANTVSSAASRMGISQPAVSRLIADLERTIGFQLFERRRRRLHLRPEGRILFQEVEKSFRGIEKIAHCAMDIRDYKSGYVRLASMPAVSLGLLPSVIRKFHCSFPSVGVSIQIRSSQKVTEWISAQQFDLGLAALPVSLPGVSVDYVYSVPCVCVLPKTHPLTKLKTITPDELSEEEFISLGSDSVLRFKIDQVLQRAETRTSAELETTMSLSALLLVENGIGLSIIDPFTAASFGNRVEVRPFSPVILYEFAIISPTHVPKSRSAEAFAQILREQTSDFSRV